MNPCKSDTTSKITKDKSAATSKTTKDKYPQMYADQSDTHLEHRSRLQFDEDILSVRLSNIICTIGPSSINVEMLEKMMNLGMGIARINLSHGTREYYQQAVTNVRAASKNYSNKIGYEYHVAIAFDTKGPEIRTGLFEGSQTAEVDLKTGATVKLTTNKDFADKCTKDIIYVDYANIAKVVKPGDYIYIDDGFVALVVQEASADTLVCTIENGGRLGSKKGVNLPGASIDLPSVSEKDIADLKFGVEEGIDIVFASFIRDAAGVADVRSVLGEKGKGIKIVSKIENQSGLHNLDEIITASDGIMVARGDLGIEIPAERVFIAQKVLIARCNKAGKPVICATQMLESMIKNPRPTRAEISDIANAILDGADCVMLSGETAKGAYPLECINIMAKTSMEAETILWHKNLYNDLVLSNASAALDAGHSTAIAAVAAANKTVATTIVVITRSGLSAHLISKYRPRCPIIAVTPNLETARQALLYRGLIPVVYKDPPGSDWAENVDAHVRLGVDFGKKNGFIQTGDRIVIVAAWRHKPGLTNTMHITVVE